MSQGQRRLAAIMFTDIFGYTALGQKNESLSLALVLKQKDLIRPILRRHQGKEVKTIGDAFLVEFQSALHAVRCAYDIQRATRELNISLPEESRIHLRIGIHLGDVVGMQGDISGDTVNIASRIEPLAEVGGVCITRQIYDDVRKKFELPFVSLGVKSLKNVDTPVETYKMVMPWSLGGDTGETETGVGFDRNRVAILPFRSMSPDPNDEYFAEGMTEELITTLSQIGQLTVIGRTSVMQYKNTTKRIREISRELSAGTLIEGSVRKAGNRVRITVQLLDSKTEGRIWAENYDRDLNDVFEIQTAVAKQVSDSLRVKILPGEETHIKREPTKSTGAYIFYLKGRYYWNERNEEGMRKAIEYFNQATKIDSNFALGYSGLADCYQIMGYNQLADFKPAFESAKKYAEKALELDENLAEAHTAIAVVRRVYDRDYVASEFDFIRGIELKPSYSTAHQWYSMSLLTQRRFEEAESEVRKAIELNPLSLIIRVSLGDFYYYNEMYDQAIQEYRRVIDLDPSFMAVHSAGCEVQTYVRKRMYEEALQCADKVGEERTSQRKLLRGYVFAAMGKSDESRKLLSEAKQGYRAEHLSPYFFALSCFQMGDNESGFGWLQRAYEEYDGQIQYLAVDREFDSVINDQRYRTVSDGIGLGKIRR